jgi:hypothetical protein
VSNGTWRELVRRDFALDDRQIERWAAELAESAVAEAGSREYASAVTGIATAAAAAPPSFASVPAQQVGPSPFGHTRAGRENELKRLYAYL